MPESLIMPLPSLYFPKQSHVLKCDFKGFVAPEMIKVRPVVIISPSSRHGVRLCTVVPLSTTPPMNREDFDRVLAGVRAYLEFQTD